MRDKESGERGGGRDTACGYEFTGGFILYKITEALHGNIGKCSAAVHGYSDRYGISVEGRQTPKTTQSAILSSLYKKSRWISVAKTETETNVHTQHAGVCVCVCMIKYKYKYKYK